jgi:topoisomerase-4 subunit B
LSDFLAETVENRPTVTPKPFVGDGQLNGGGGRIEWAVTWPEYGDGFMSSYCNTVPTAQGGTHETGLRTALSRGLKAYGEMTGNKRAAQIVADDVMISACGLL